MDNYTGVDDEFDNLSQQENTLNINTRALLQRVNILRRAIRTTKDTNLKLDCVADLLGVVAGLAGLAVASQTSSREIADLSVKVSQ